MRAAYIKIQPMIVNVHPVTKENNRRQKIFFCYIKYISENLKIFGQKSIQIQLRAEK